MRQFIALTLFLCLAFSLNSQTVKNINVSNAGTLKNLISQTEAKTVSSLTVTGNIDARDFAYIRDFFKVVSSIDLSGSTVVAYNGNDGTNSGTTTSYAAGEIPMYAFYNPFLMTYKQSLTSIKLPAKVTSIGSLAFYFCWNLSGQISLPASLVNIADYAFYGCYALPGFNVSTSNKRYSAVNGVLFSKNADTLFIFPNAKNGSYAIPNTVKRVHNSAFENAWNLTALTLGSNITSVGSYAFCNCSGLTSDLALPSTLVSIEEGGFYSCYNLKGSVTLPASLKSLGYYSFFGSDGITSFNVNSSNTVYAAQNGILYSKKLDSLYICPAGKTGPVVIPESVKLIGSHAFYNCANLSGVLNIPSGVDYIGYYAFYGCKGISAYSVNAANGYFSSNQNVLYSKDLKRIIACPATKSGTFVFPDSTRYIDPCAFSFCSNLSGEMKFTKGIEYLGDFAFYGCTGISGFAADEENKYFSAYDGLLYNKLADTLYLSTSGKSGQVVLPQGLKHIGTSAFDGCQYITSVKLPSGLNSLGNYAFEYCTSLTDINLPQTLTSIGYGVLNGCTSMRNINVLLPEPHLIDYYYFNNINKSLCALNVPLNSISSYRNAPYWEDFVNITEKDFATAVFKNDENNLTAFKTADGLTVRGLKKGGLLEIYSVNGKVIAKRNIPGEELSIKLPQSGVYIIKSGRESIKQSY